MRHGRAHSFDYSQVLVAAITSTHLFQHSIAAGLKRHVQLGHHVVGFGHCLNHIVSEGRWVWRGETNPLETLDCAAGSKQLGESTLVTELDPVRVYVLT